MDLVARIQAFFPAGVNLRVVRYADLHGLHFVKRLRIDGASVPLPSKTDGLTMWVYGEAVTVPRNEGTPYGPSVHVGSVFAAEHDRYKQYELHFSKESVLEDIPPDLPNSAAIILAVLADTAAHEAGHSLGLVHESYLAADGNRHNPAADFSKLMNAMSGKNRDAWLSPRTWMPVNLQYLRFILPTP